MNTKRDRKTGLDGLEAGLFGRELEGLGQSRNVFRSTVRTLAKHTSDCVLEQNRFQFFSYVLVPLIQSSRLFRLCQDKGAGKGVTPTSGRLRSVVSFICESLLSSTPLSSLEHTARCDGGESVLPQYCQ